MIDQIIDRILLALLTTADSLQRLQYHRLSRRAVHAYHRRAAAKAAEEREWSKWEEQHKRKLVRNNARRWN